VPSASWKVLPESVEYAALEWPWKTATTWLGLFGFTATPGSFPRASGDEIVTMCAPGARGSDWALAHAANPSNAAILRNELPKPGRIFIDLQPVYETNPTWVRFFKSVGLDCRH
jgi:hypothetical protein